MLHMKGPLLERHRSAQVEIQWEPRVFSNDCVFKNVFENIQVKLIVIAFDLTNVLKCFHFIMESKYNY